MFDSDRRFPVSLPDISRFTSLFADRTRAAICAALMDGRAWTAGELAKFAHISKSNATEQIHKLVAGGIVKEHRQGRHRYLMISSEEVADLIETLARMSGDTLRSPRSLRADRSNRDFRKGRTCYRHLAGELGVCLLEQFCLREYLTADFQITEKGVGLLKGWGISEPEMLEAKPCMDTTCRRFHMAGSLGTAICERFLEMGWIARKEAARCVFLTDEGIRSLAQAGIDMHSIRDEPH